MANLITSAQNEAHITPLQDSLWHRSLIGNESCIFSNAEKLALQVMSNTKVRIKSGVGMLQGRFFCIDPGTYDEVTIANGAQGMARIDLICAKVTQNENGTQSFSWEVTQGESVSSDPQVPSYTEGDLDSGDAAGRLAFATVTLSGIEITATEIIADVMIDDCSMTEAEYDELAALLGITE